MDGYRRDARFNSPWGICYDHHSQSLLVCESPNSRLRRVLLNGITSISHYHTSASYPISYFLFYHLSSLSFLFFAGEVSTICEIQFPVAVAVTNNQTILVSTYRHKLYKVTLQSITPIALSPSPPLPLSPSPSFTYPHFTSFILSLIFSNYLY